MPILSNFKVKNFDVDFANISVNILICSFKTSVKSIFPYFFKHRFSSIHNVNDFIFRIVSNGLICVSEILRTTNFRRKKGHIGKELPVLVSLLNFYLEDFEKFQISQEAGIMELNVNQTNHS